VVAANFLVPEIWIQFPEYGFLKVVIHHVHEGAADSGKCDQYGVYQRHWSLHFLMRSYSRISTTNGAAMIPTIANNIMAT
jgi:extradiol dioxygenase family protein